MANIKQEEIVKTLICLADSLDHEGKAELAEEVDMALASITSDGLVAEAARPRAPLKGLEDAVKESLIKFLVDSRDSLSGSVKNIEEFFRRLKYFGVEGTIKDLGLDRMLLEMKDVEAASAEAVKRFHEITKGRKVRQNELAPKVMEEQSAMDFFKGQEPATDKKMVTEEKVTTVEEPKEEGAGKELEEFWKEYEEGEKE
jgi:hypothetical protein